MGAAHRPVTSPRGQPLPPPPPCAPGPGRVSPVVLFLRGAAPPPPAVRRHGFACRSSSPPARRERASGRRAGVFPALAAWPASRRHPQRPPDCLGKRWAGTATAAHSASAAARHRGPPSPSGVRPQGLAPTAGGGPAVARLFANSGDGCCKSGSGSVTIARWLRPRGERGVVAIASRPLPPLLPPAPLN